MQCLQLTTTCPLRTVMAASFLSWWMVTHFETKIAVAHFYILHFNILGFQISMNSLTAALLVTLTIMHSSMARAGVQWNIPVESYLKRKNKIWKKSHFTRWRFETGSNLNDVNWRFWEVVNCRLAILWEDIETVKMVTTSISNLWSNFIIWVTMKCWTHFMTVCSKSMSTRSFTIFPFFSTFSWKGLKLKIFKWVGRVQR